MWWLCVLAQRLRSCWWMFVLTDADSHPQQRTDGPMRDRLCFDLAALLPLNSFHPAVFPSSSDRRCHSPFSYVAAKIAWGLMQRLSAHPYLCVLLFFRNGPKLSLTPFVLASLRLRDLPWPAFAAADRAALKLNCRGCVPPPPFFFIYFTCQVCEGPFIKAQSRVSEPHLKEKKNPIWLPVRRTESTIMHSSAPLCFQKPLVSVCCGG